MLNNSAFALGLFYPNHTPDKHFWNKSTYPIEYAEEKDAFLTDCFMIDDADLLHTLCSSTPNGIIHDYCMCDEMKIANAKDHLKYGTFKSMINQKYHSHRHQWGKILRNELLKKRLKKLFLSSKYFCKMINDSVDPKVLFFFQDIITNSATAIKYYLSDSCCEEISKIEDMLPSDIKPNNPDAGDLITKHVGNQTIDQVSKVMLLLKLYFFIG